MRLKFIFALFTGLLFLSGCNFTLAADITPPPGMQASPSQPALQATNEILYPIVPPDPLNGAGTFAEKCAPCHGPSGLGNGSRADQLPNPVIPIGTADVARQVAPAAWYQVVTQGNLERFMPPFQSLSDRQRWDVVAYAFSLSMPVERIQQGQELYQANCAACHGESGAGDGPAAGSLPLPDFNDQEYMVTRTNADFFQSITAGQIAGMPAFGEQFSDEQRWALAEYIRSITFASVLAQSPSGSVPQETTPDPAEEETETLLTPMAATSIISDSHTLGTVSGFVMNASGGELPPDLMVDLFGFDHVQVVYTDSVKLADDGSYLFEKIDMSPGLVYVTTVDFQGTTYGSEITSVEEESDDFVLPIQIYETTKDDSVLRIDRVHLFFEVLDENTIRVVELYVLSNPGEKTLIADEDGGAVVSFSLPEGAQNLQFQDGALGDRYVTTSDGFSDSVPIRPGMGNYQVLFSYEMPYSRSLDLVRPMSHATDATVILIPEDGIKVKGDSIQDAGIRDVQGVAYHMYNGGSLGAGEELKLTLSGRPSSGESALSPGSNTNLIFGLGALGIVLIVAGVWLYRRNSEMADVDEDLPETPDEPEYQSVESVMDTILALDDLYKEGELPEEAYLERRAELKARLKALMDE